MGRAGGNERENAVLAGQAGCMGCIYRIINEMVLGLAEQAALGTCHSRVPFPPWGGLGGLPAATHPLTPAEKKAKQTQAGNLAFCPQGFSSKR